MIWHNSGELSLFKDTTIIKLVEVDVEFDIIDIDVPDNLTVTQIGCVSRWPNWELDVEALRKGLEHMVILFDDDPDATYSFVWREMGRGFDDAVLAMLHHTVSAAGYDVTVYEK